MERKGLGRGLSALMSDVNLRPESDGPRRADQKLPVERIRPNPNQPRKDFHQGSLDSLADSLRQKGVIQPLIVRPMGQDYEIVAGERRWRAAQLAQLHEVPVIIRELDDTEVLEVAIIENIQRSDLNAIEEAMGLKSLIDRFGHTQEKVAEALSRSRSHVTNLLRLLSLPPQVQHLVREGMLSAGHARALIGAPNAEELASRIITEGLSVRDVERLMREKADPKPKQAPRARATEKDPDTRALEADLSAHLGMAVTIEDQGGKGVLSIRYTDFDSLDWLCARLSMGPGALMAKG